MATTKIKIKRGPIESFTSNSSVYTGTENEMFMSTNNDYKRLFMSDGTATPTIINPVVRYNHSYLTDIHTGCNADSDGFKSYPILFSNVAGMTTKGVVEDFVFVNGSYGVASSFKVVFLESIGNPPACRCGSSIGANDYGYINFTTAGDNVYTGTTAAYLSNTSNTPLWFSFDFGNSNVRNVNVVMDTSTGVVKFYEYSGADLVANINVLSLNMVGDGKQKGYDAMECSFNYALNVRKRELGNNKYFVYKTNNDGVKLGVFGFNKDFFPINVYEQNLLIGGFNKNNIDNATEKTTFGTISLKYRTKGTLTDSYDTDAVVTLIPNTSRNAQNETNILLPTESCELVGYNPQTTRYGDIIKIGTEFDLSIGPEKYSNSVVVGNSNYKTVDFVGQNIETLASVTSTTRKTKLFADFQTYTVGSDGNVTVTTNYGWVDKDTITGGESVTYNPLASDSSGSENYVVTGGGNGTQLLNGNGKWVSGKNVEISDTTVETIADNTVAETYEYGGEGYTFYGGNFVLSFNKFLELLTPNVDKTFEYFFDFSVLFSENGNNPSFINLYEFFKNVDNTDYKETPKKLTINLYNMRKTLGELRNLGLIPNGTSGKLIQGMSGDSTNVYPIVWSDEKSFQIKLYTEPITFNKTYIVNSSYNYTYELLSDFAHINRYLLEYVINTREVDYVWYYKDFIKFDVIRNNITDEKGEKVYCYHIIPYANSGLGVFPPYDYIPSSTTTSEDGTDTTE